MKQDRLWVDIEAYSSVDLRKTGVYRYAESPDFFILMAAWSSDGETVNVALDQDEIRNIPGLRDPDVVKVAHNAQFERICFSRFFGLPTGEYLPAEEWHDTQAVAGQRGWPQKLATLGKALGGEQKDEAGTRLINLFCKPNRNGVRTMPEEKPVQWLDFIAYCEQDVQTLIDVDRRLGGHVTPGERAVFLSDQAINDHGITIDQDLAQWAVEAADRNQARQKARLVALTEGAVQNPSSQPQMMAWVRSQGLPATNLRAATVESLLKGDELTPVQREVFELRQELALVASKKYATALESVNRDGRLRGTLKYFGAHTGRWSGRGTQLQNLPRLSFDNQVDEWLAIDELKSGEGATAEDLKRLVRPLFTGPFTVVDYGAIEARVIAWLAGEDWVLDAFRAGRDIYVETADRMGGLKRSQGKIAVLALGYNGGSNSLRNMAGGSGFYVDEAGEIVDEAHPGAREMTDEELRQRFVYPWRAANPRIVRLWEILGNAVSDLGDAGPLLHFTESHNNLGRVVNMWLPSGRPISYHGVKWERYVVKDPETDRILRKEGWRYANPKDPFNHKMRVGTYGGKLAENATQAVARDLLAEALVRLHQRGYRVAGHVHDEFLIEGEHDVDEIRSVVNEAPSWATGLPIDGSGFVCERYRKE